MSYFDAIAIEAYISSTWIDLTPDVRGTIRGKWGIQSPFFLERVADIGTLTFTLDNSENNSAGKLGYYSPSHANAMSGWKTGIPVRVTWTYDGNTQRKLYYINHDGLRISTGVSGARTVDVTCSDWMSYASSHTLNLVSSQSNKTITDAVNALIADMPIAPQRTATILFPETSTAFDTVFDISSSETTVLGEFTRLAVSEWGLIFLSPDPIYGETLQIWTRSEEAQDAHRGYFAKHTSECGFLLLSDDSFLLLSDDASKLIRNEQMSTPTWSDADYDFSRGSAVTYGSQLINQISTRTYPRNVGTSLVQLWKMQSSVSLAPGETKSGIRAQYRDPNNPGENINGTDFVTPVASTDYQAFANADGSGANLTADLQVSATFGASEVELSITNTGAATLFTGGPILFQVRGKPVTIYEQTERVTKDDASISTYGKKEISFDIKYVTDIESVRNLASAILITQDYKTPKTFIEEVWLCANHSHKNMNLFMIAYPGMQLQMSDAMSGVNNQNYRVNGIEFEIQPGNIVFYKLILTKYFNVPDF